MFTCTMCVILFWQIDRLYGIHRVRCSFCKKVKNDLVPAGDFDWAIWERIDAFIGVDAFLGVEGPVSHE